jgi:hypothetical protein
MGKIAGPYTPILKVCTHKKVIAGADVIVDPSMYPAAPATMHPTANPTMILMFLRKGDPKISVRMIEMNDRNPRPMNSGDPHGRGLGAKMVGHSSKMPDVAVAHPLDPPAQLGAPDEPTREAPIRSTTVPVIIGGNRRLRVLGGRKAKNTSNREQMIDVPKTFP